MILTRVYIRITWNISQFLSSPCQLCDSFWIKIIHYLFDSFSTGMVTAYNRCWVFGDKFCSRSYEKYFKARTATDYNSYIKTHFDVSGYFGSGFINDNPSLISRMCNLMVSVMSCRQANNKILPLPKIIVMVMDDDLLCLFKDVQDGVTAQPMSRILNHIMTEHECSIAVFKEFLPAKSVMDGYPHILWIQAPLHDKFANNGDRIIFNRCLEETIKLHGGVSCLALKKVWNPQNVNLFVESCNRFTNDGFHDYWEAVDHTVRFCDSILLKKLEKAKLQTSPVRDQKGQHSSQKDHLVPSQKGKKRFSSDRFRWQNPALNVTSPAIYRRLPAPRPVGYHNLEK